MLWAGRPRLGRTYESLIQCRRPKMAQRWLIGWGLGYWVRWYQVKTFGYSGHLTQLLQLMYFLRFFPNRACRSSFKVQRRLNSPTRRVGCFS